MLPDVFFVGMLLALAVLGLFYAVKQWSEFRGYLSRKRALSEWATELGLTMADLEDPSWHLFKFERGSCGYDLEKQYQATEPLNEIAGDFYNILSGHFEGRAVRVFDYCHTVYNGRYSTKQVYSAVQFKLPQPRTTFAIRPHGWWDKVSSLFGRHDIVVGHKTFDRRYHVSGPYEAEIKVVLRPEILEVFLNSPADVFLCDGEHLLLLKLGEADTEELELMLSDGSHLAGTL